MTDEFKEKLAAHQALYSALADTTTAAAETRPGSLGQLDASLKRQMWQWEPSPTDFASWSEYDAAMQLYQKGLKAWREAD